MDLAELRIGEVGWQSCAFYDNGDEVFDDYTDPWIVGRTGLVVERAIYNFTETLEELTGIWVRFEIDPNGSTHTCASPPDTIEWAFQAHS